MGFLDKAKQFVGGKNMATVNITVIERQPAHSATFPVTDSVLKGTMVIEAKADCTLLKTKYEVWLYINKDGIESPHLVVQDYDPSPNVSYHESCLQLPRELKTGEIIEKPWMVMDVDLPRILANNGYPNPAAATRDPNVRLEVRCIADVKGSPFDPSAAVNVRLVAS